MSSNLSRFNRAFSPVSNFIAGAADSFSRARSAQRILDTPEAAFKNGNTSRQEAVRRIFDI